MSILERIQGHEDLARLSRAEQTQLCEELRRFLVSHVAQTGGHLASNLGVVELSVALETVFDTRTDRLVFDVGHQSYIHKILTDRRDQFSSLRCFGGIAGFPKPCESVTDAFVAGHASNSVSVALGMARARTLQREHYSVLALIGDGATTGGLAYEGLNDAGASHEPLIVILNDNEMSIAQNVGGMAHHLSKLRTRPGYFGVKRVYRAVTNRIPGGKFLYRTTHRVKNWMKNRLLDTTLFEDMGFTYIGPVDGHNEEELERTLRTISQRPGPHFLHVVTKKGKGYQPAEMNPGNYHGVSAFDPDGMPDPEVAPKESFSTTFGQALAREAAQNSRICAITAAMKYGTGLQFFSHSAPERFFDVGMAEQHAVTFAAGLASQGMLPVVCIYSTFLQRSYDQILHDVNLLQENVVFAIDRAGFVPADGETHQGVYDPAFLSQIGMPLYAPSNYAELTYWLHELLKDGCRGPRAIRYPRGGENARLAQYGCSGQDYDFLHRTEGAQAVLISYADEMDDILTACEKLTEHRINCDTLKLVKLFPFTEKIIEAVKNYKIILFAEECVEWGSIGEHLAYCLQQAGWNGTFLHAAVHTANLPHATVPQIKQVTGLDADTLAQQVMDAWMKGENIS